MNNKNKDLKEEIIELGNNLLQMAMIISCDKTQHPEFVKGYIHVVKMVEDWTRRTTAEPEPEHQLAEVIPISRFQ